MPGLNPGPLGLLHWQPDTLTSRLDLIHARLGLIHTLGLISSKLSARSHPLSAGSQPHSWLNLIHIDDAVAVVCTVADAASPRGLYVVADGHPVRRRDWYGTLAKLTGSPEPHWDTAAPRPRGADKRVDPKLLFRDLAFRPAHPNPLAALADLVETSS